MRKQFSSRIGLFFILNCMWLSFSNVLVAQASEYELKAALKHLRDNKLNAASINFQAGWNAFRNDQNLLFKAGNCHLDVNNLKDAKMCLERLHELNPGFSGLPWSLARTYHFNQEFYNAIKFYKAALRELGTGHRQADFIRNELIRCAYGNQYQRRDPIALVEPFGNDINSENDEFAACPSVNYNGKYYFSIKYTLSGTKLTNVSKKIKKEQADVFVTQLENGKWAAPLKLHSELNSNLNEEVLDFCGDGNVMIFSRELPGKNYEIFTDTFHRDAASLHYSVWKSPVQSSIGDKSLCIFQDSVLIFSSARTGGYGANDLYLSIWRQGMWMDPVNLGPQVNGPFNEAYPYLSKDGKTLYFSSDRLESMGGYDVFKLKYFAESNSWSEVFNLGIPVNSPGDDTHFKLTQDGLAAVMTSDRKRNNLGNRDLYFVYFKQALEEQSEDAQGSTLSLLMNPEVPEIKIIDVPASKDINRRTVHSLSAEPFYYRDENYLLEPKNKLAADQLAKFLMHNPGLHLQITGHAYEENRDALNLFFSVKKAESLSLYLQKQGIDKNRMIHAGLGRAIPLAKTEPGQSGNAAAMKFNKRIEYKIIGADSSLHDINYKPLPIHPHLKAEIEANCFSQSEHVFYILYLGEAPSILNHPLVDHSKGFVFAEKSEGSDLYRYYFGSYNAFKQAFEDWQNFRKQGIEIKGIKARYKDHWILKNDIVDLALDFPDLLNYLDFLNSEE